MKRSKLYLAAMSCSLLFVYGGLTGCDIAAQSSQNPVAVAPDHVTPALLWAHGAPPIADSITKGGNGGEIVRVTSLESRGPGTLRAALDMNIPRTIVFDVAGVIDLQGDNISINEPNVTIAGQTAPSPGISIIRGGVVIATNDVIVQHLRIRPGDLGEAPRSGRDIDAITTSAASNIVVDHCSLSWATDENLSASGPRFTGDTVEEWREGTSHDILYSNNIIAEGLAHSTHAKGEHSKGSLIHDNVSDILIYGNLYAHNFERSPLFKGGVQGAVINNFIYNPGQRAIHYNLQGLEWGKVPPVAGSMAAIGNVMRAGPSTEEGLPLIILGGDGDLNLRLEDNIAVDKWGNPLPMLGRNTTSRSVVNETSDIAIPKDVTVISAIDVERYVLKNAGARPWDRDKHDVRILADTAEGRGEIIDSQSQVGGYPVVKEQRRKFKPEDWNLDSMTPKSLSTLDAGVKAKGT